MAYVYIVRCEDDSLYTGITKDIAKRINNHVSGKGPSHAKYMRSHKPVELAALWKTDEYKVAAKLEYAIKKRLTRKQKLELVAQSKSIDELFPNLSGFEFERIYNVSLEECLAGVSNEK